MSIVMAALTPHPPLIIPEIGKESREGVRRTINSMEEISEEIRSKEPDILITISPHGPVFTDAISILDKEKLEGDFSDFACPEVRLVIKTDQAFIKRIRKTQNKRGLRL